MRKKITLLLLLLTITAFLSACGEDATPTSPVSVQTTTNATNTTNTTNATATSSSNNSSSPAATGGVASSVPTPTPTLAAVAARATQTVAVGNTPAGSVVPVTSGSNSSGKPTTTPGPKGGVTMKEAYELVAPKIQAWAKDAVLTTIAIDPDDQIGLLPDGRAASWFFTAVSVSLSKQDNWQVKAPTGQKATVSETVSADLDADTTTAQVAEALPPVASLIDTNRLMEIARQNGGDKSDAPVGFELHKSAKQTETLAFNLVFQNGQQVTPLRIDAQNGKLLENVKG